MATTQLQNAVIARLSEQRLIELTNDDKSQNTIDTDRLTVACEDTIGIFRLETGILEDYENPTHIQILVQGVLHYLEQYISRSNAIMSMHGRSFFAGLRSIREKRVILPASGDCQEFRGRKSLSSGNCFSDNEVST